MAGIFVLGYFVHCGNLYAPALYRRHFIQIQKIMWPGIQRFFLQPKTLLVVYILLALVASVQALLLPPHIFSGIPYKEYNNYVIFRQSFYHLLSAKNMYVLYPAEQWDLYKYSPTFALVMGLLAYLPDTVGLTIWELTNVLVLFAAVRMLQFNNRTQSLLLWFMAIELLTSLQNSQSNGIMAGLFIAAYACMQRGKPGWAALWLVVATFIKVYGAVGFCLFLFYPGKIRFIAYAILWTVLLAIMPVVVTSVPTLVWQYQNWAKMMAEDQNASYGLSVMGWLHSWFRVNSGKGLVSLVGLLLFMLPFIRLKLYRNDVFRLMVVAFILLWVIIFNHKAESPTFIIAVAGAGIWYCARPRDRWRTVLMWSVFIFTCLSPTDIFPPFIRQGFFVPYVIKAIPCIILWGVVLVEIMMLRPDEQLPASAVV